MRVPRPDLTVSLGTPNACTGCHQKNGARWAAETVERWYGHRPQGYQRFAEALAYAERGLAEAGPSLAQLAQNPTQPAIAVATALEALVNYPIRAGVEAAQAGLTNPDVLVRRASVSALAILPPARRLPLVAPLLDDSSRSVRIEAAYTLADTMASATAAQRAAFERAAAEYEAVQRYNADSPEARVALGNFYARQGRAADAQAQLQSALALEPAFVPAYVSLADLMRAQDRDAEAERILRDGLRQTPGAAALHHTLGLTLVRLQRTAEALDELRRATQRAPTEARFAYVYAVGLYSDGKTKAAIAEVDRALQQHPDNRDLLVAATNFRHESGDLPGARRYALRLYERYPNDLDAALLARQLGALR